MEEREGGWENCVPACSVIKRNIDSTPVYRVIHIHGVGAYVYLPLSSLQPLAPCRRLYHSLSLSLFFLSVFLRVPSMKRVCVRFGVLHSARVDSDISYGVHR